MGSKKEADAVRFAVGTPDNPQSFVWRMWLQGDDVYLCARDAGGYWKVSLHRSGVWRIAFVSQLRAQDSDADRVILKWKRPGEFAPGWTSSVGIVVSSIQATRPLIPMRAKLEHVAWFELPAEGNRLLFKVLFSKGAYTQDDLKVISLKGDRLAARMLKRSGEAVWLIVREDRLHAMEATQIRDAMDKIKIHLKPGSSGDSLWARSLVFLSEDVPGVSTQPTILDVPLGRENLDVSPG